MTAEGTAAGQPTQVEAHGGDVITVSPLWSDVEGVIFYIDSPDAGLDRAGLQELIAKLQGLVDIAPPPLPVTG